MVIDGPINRDAFTAYVTQVLVPELSPGDIVIMDNLSSHKGQAIRDAIESAGAEMLFLPLQPGLQSNRKGLPNDPPDHRLLRSRSSRPTCAKPPSELSTACGTPSAASSTSTLPKNAPITSQLADMMQLDRNPL